MSPTIGLMGFGRIGRNLFRLVCERDDGVRIGAISDIADPEALTYLLRYDSIYGPFPEPVSYADGVLRVRDQEIPFLDGRDPGDVDWQAHGVDYVVEATGRSRRREEALRHLDRGARRVILCAPPASPPDATIVVGVNEADLHAEHRVVSNASCTAHAAAPVLAVLMRAFGVARAHLTSVHGYTSVQRLADVPGGDLRLSRAAAENIVPSETNAASVIECVLPALAGRISAGAMRVPVPNGSVVDATVWLERGAGEADVVEALRRAASGPLAGILEIATDPIVSRDVYGTRASGIVDARASLALDETLHKVIIWFDNSWPYACRVLDLVARFAAQDGVREEVRR